MLFFIRVIAVWNHYKPVQGLFFVLWLCVIASTITFFPGLRVTHLGPTMKCITTWVAQYTEAVAIVGFINDSAVFFAITYRILSYTLVEEDLKSRANAFFSGSGLSRLSHALLQGGQHYYL
jgi:hypothetical protein